MQEPPSRGEPRGTHTSAAQRPHGERPEFGPGGYLPERAAKRARKIVLREQMGLGWPLAAVLAALLLVGVGAAYFLTQTGPPGDPFVDAGRLDQVDPRGAESLRIPSGDEVLVVRGGGGVAVFQDPGVEVTWCRQSRRIESSAGQVWALDGQLVGGGGESLQPLRSAVFDGVVYVDPAPRTPAPDPAPAGERPTCLDAAAQLSSVGT